MLARFAIEGAARPFARVIDVGSGPGALALMLLATGWAQAADAIERDPFHAELAARNAADNQLANRCTVHHASVDAPLSVERAQLVISNPPWFEQAAGAVAPDARRAHARTWLDGSLGSLVKAARAGLGVSGRFVVSWPSQRTTELLLALAEVGLHAKRLRFVHPREGREAQVVFVEAKPGRAGGLRVERPLFVRGAGESYAPETADALSGRWPMPR